MKSLNNRAVSIIEFSLLFIIIIGAFLIMQNYIQRGIFGNWARSGQSYAYGRQYDPQKSIECAFDDQSNMWYDQNCYRFYIANNQCNGDAGCQEGIIASGICTASGCGNSIN